MKRCLMAAFIKFTKRRGREGGGGGEDGEDGESGGGGLSRGKAGGRACAFSDEDRYYTVKSEATVEGFMKICPQTPRPPLNAAVMAKEKEPGEGRVGAREFDHQMR